MESIVSDAESKSENEDEYFDCDGMYPSFYTIVNYKDIIFLTFFSQLHLNSFMIACLYKTFNLQSS